MNSGGRNFTEREKCRLLDLIQRWKHVIENKSTNAITVAAKNRKWLEITTEFNSTAEVPRSLKQLHTAYLNLKRTTRQNVANENVKKYLQSRGSNNDVGASQKHEEPVLQKDNEIVELQRIVRELKKDEIADKRGVLATGGGLYQPVLSTVGSQMLAVMGDQIEPLLNKFDSASSYYNIDGEVGDDEEVQAQGEHHGKKQEELPPPERMEGLSPPEKKEELSPPERKANNTRRKVVKKSKKKNENGDLKHKIYRIKLQTAKLERSKQLEELRLTKKKQKLLEIDIKIREKEYENLCNK